MVPPIGLQLALAHEVLEVQGHLEGSRVAENFDHAGGGGMVSSGNLTVESSMAEN